MRGRRSLSCPWTRVEVRPGPHGRRPHRARPGDRPGRADLAGGRAMNYRWYTSVKRDPRDLLGGRMMILGL